MSAILDITNLRVRRSEAFALRIGHLRLQAGKILCVTGPNGSGKTTLIDCLTGLLAPTSGVITVCGQSVSNNLRATKAIIGFVPDDEQWFVKELCAKEYFALLQSIYIEAGVTADTGSNATRLAQSLHFTAFDQQLGSLSHGNKKKVQIIAGLMHEPKVIFLDELRNGLDPLAIIAAEELIKQEATRGACIVAATHDLWWAQRVADEIVLLIDGSVALHEKTATLVQRHGSLENLFLKTIRSRTKIRGTS
ncbi:MAG: ABC transporter ATP-binding protein [Patescibacteria group bacterium]